jgi:hypothetical protein
MGSKVRVHENEEGKGHVQEEDVPKVRGSALKFTGVAGRVDYDEIKVGHSFPGYLFAVSILTI